MCRYKNLTDNEKIIMIAEENEKAWKNRQAKIKDKIKSAKEEGRAEGWAEGERNRNI